MRNWTKNLSRAAVVAAGAVALGSGASMGLASAGSVGAMPHGPQVNAPAVVPNHIKGEASGVLRMGAPTGGGADAALSARGASVVDQTQLQGHRSGALLQEKCGDMAGHLAKAKLACPMSESESEDEGEDDDSDLGVPSMMGGTFNGPISAFGGAWAMVNVAKSYGRDYAEKEEDDCNRCDESYAKPSKAKPFKSKAFKSKPFKVKGYKAKPRKVRSHKAKGFSPKSPRWGGMKGHTFYTGHDHPLPSTRRLAVTRPAPESAARTAAVPGPRMAARPKEGQSGFRALIDRLVKPVSGLRRVTNVPNTDQLQQQDVMIRSDAKAGLQGAGLSAAQGRD